MEALIRADGTVQVDEATAGYWRVDESGTHGILSIQAECRSFEIVGPFGSGHRVRVRGSRAGTLELAYNWRDGYWLTVDFSPSELDLEDGRLTDRQGVLAHLSWTPEYVRLRFRHDVTVAEAATYATLIAVDRFFADRTGPFRRAVEQ